MDILSTLITLSRNPKFGTDEYKKWIEQYDLIQFLQELPGLDEMVLYASGSYTLFLYSALVPTRLVTPPDVKDLQHWNGVNPFSSWGIGITAGKQPRVFLSPPLGDTGSKTLDRGEQIIFARRFDGRQEQQLYIEVSPRLTQPFELHYVPERSAYCRFDEHGDVEDVIRISEIPSNGEWGNGQAVIIRRDILDQYMTITSQSLVLLFDSTRFDFKNFSGWPQQDVEYHEEHPEIWYHMGHCGNIASFIHGFQIIRSRLTRKDLLKRYAFGQLREQQYATFIAHDWKHNVVRECSCDPRLLGNYFVESDLPFETSPVFFRAEVLLKYKADPDKYQVRGRSIRCRNAWDLAIYDVNDAGQVFTYLKYLSHLPYDEQLYWKSFNEHPKAPISKRALRADFEGSWESPYDPLESLKQTLRELQEARVAWWSLRDQALMENVHCPLTQSTEEWAREILALDKLLIEGFEIGQLRSRATRLGRTVDKDWGSLKLLREVLVGLGKNEFEVQQIVAPFQELSRLRTKVSAHASGKEAKRVKSQILREHKSYRAHFQQLCAKCHNAINKLQSVL